MWIIPKNYQHYSPSARAMVESSSDLKQLSEHLEQSLMWRSKPSQLRTWLIRWKRGGWFWHLCGRILKPFLWNDFETALILSLPVIRASHSAQQENEKGQKTQGTYGLTSTGQLTLFAPQSVFLKTWKGTYPLASEKSLPIWLASDIEWKVSVENQRGEYSRRVKSAHRTEENDCSFWPTITQQYDMESSGKNGNKGTYLLGAVKDGQQDQGKNNTSGKNQESSSWPTPCSRDYKGANGVGGVIRKDGKSRMDQLPNAVLYGQLPQ